MANPDDDLPIVWRDHGDKTAYEAARTRVFSTKLPDRYPTAVVRPRTDRHVVGSIRLAEKLGARVAVRSGGHSWAFWSIRQDAVLVDLVDYKHIGYDEATRIVTTTTSVTSAEMTAFVAERGRFIPTGHCAGVGLGGFMLQGGMGHNSRSYGYMCEYLIGLDVATANGEIKHCDEFENPDLFWAARGSGPDSEEDARSKLAPLIDTHPAGAVFSEDCGDTTFQQEYEEAEKAVWAENHRYIADTVWLGQDSDMVSVCKEAFMDIPDCGVAFWEPMNPVSRRDPPSKDMALSITTDYYIALYAIYPDSNDDAENEAWVKKYMATLTPYAVGTYLGDHDIQMRETKYWSDEAGEKLMAIRKKWDPEGRICGYLDKGDKSGRDGLPNKLHQ
ncbi:hypothetical protein SLS63_007731 [Diaporthe eres]|uniref:FAD-binding PCMH-type domain-containing protein n=1 Tax=Diaporthe eres TaxID=83184 RepID=A0ABR1P4K0_DIAER